MQQNLTRALEYLVREIRTELEAQGHVASGGLVSDIEISVQQKTDDIISGKILMREYAQYIDSGTRPHHPPFSAIYEWARIVKPELSEKEVRSFSFAVINAIAAEGTPTSGSFAYSKNGRRTEFTKFAIDNNSGQFESILDLFSILTQVIGEEVDKLKQTLAA